MSADDQLREANWTRMRTAITDAASEYRMLADQLERVNFENSRGRRAPEAVISEVALMTGSNIAARMLHRLSSWAESINEIERHAAGTWQICGHTIDDPYAVCVLAPGHNLPLDDGSPVHVDADGMLFQ